MTTIGLKINLIKKNNKIAWCIDLTAAADADANAVLCVCL
jgi:hypothetical protein